MSRKRLRSQRQSHLKDHAWGGVLGLIFVAFSAALFLSGHITDAGAATCLKPLAAMPGGNDLTGEGFANEDAALGRVIDFLYAEDRTNADAVFFGPVHSFTHNVDPVIRPMSAETAKALCTAVIRLENDLATVSDASNVTLAQDTTAVREALRDAAVVLGHARPGGGAQ